MTEHQRKLKASADRAFAPEGDKPRSRTETVRICKRFLKLEEHRIRMAHRAGLGGVETGRMGADLIDVMVRFLWAESLSALPPKTRKELPISLAATGGYGRGIMNPYSDIDLTFLFPGNSSPVTQEIAKLISDFLLYLFDLRFKVGHASRSVGETLALANQDNETKTAWIESRLIAGKPQAYQELQQRFDKECMDRKENEFLRLRQADLTARHAKHENTPFVQEPNIKSGCGGLRDYQNLVWMSYARLRILNLKDLIENKLLSRQGWRELEQAYDFLHRVRNEMHYVERRASDVLTLRLQGVVATNLGYRHKRVLRRIEAFMRDYYTHTRNVLQRSSEMMDRFHLQALEEKSRSRLSIPLLQRRPKVEKFDGFIAKNERIYQENDHIFKEDSHRLMRLFLHTQQRHLRLSPELFELVQDSFRLIDRSFRYNKAVRETFEALLSNKGDVARVLRQMHRVGFLGKYMPEFGALTVLVQHEFFHRYTADEHTLRTIEKLDELGGSAAAGLEFYQQIFRELQQPAILYLALLLHDAGRAANSKSHADVSVELADAVARRLHIKGERRKLLLFLVDNHLLMYRTASTRNLEDPKVIEEFAGIVRTKENLDALLVLTVADSKGTSQQSWSGYKETAIRQLYHHAVMCLNTPADFMRRANMPLDHLQAEVHRKLGATFKMEADAHFANMPRSYFNFREADVIATHIRQFRAFFVQLVDSQATAGLLPVMHWQDHPEQGHSELTVTCWDRHLLLARIAGALAAESINILSADLFQRSDNLVLDIFRVCTSKLGPVTSARVRERVEHSIAAAFHSADFDFSDQIAQRRLDARSLDEVAAEIPQRVYINNDPSPDHTIIELQAVDRLGLLYDVFMTIGQLGLCITHARISTEKGVAIDSIYIQDQAGTKIRDRETLTQVKSHLEQAVFGFYKHSTPSA